MCVYLHGLSDPGNVGTILRSAEAFGASSVVAGPGTTDPFSPKAVRASMGAVFAVPLVKGGDLPGLTIALVPGQGVPLHEAFPFPPTPRDKKGTLVDLAQGVTLLIGAEREGLPHDIVDNADLTAHIPIATDSLNAAMAVTIALYELRIRMAGG